VTRERFVVLGLARARVEWFATVGRWATSGALPADFVRCVSVEELRVRLRSGRPFSAALLDARLPGLDRDLIAAAGEADVAVIVVDDEDVRDWRGLGAAQVLRSSFQRIELIDVLTATARPIGAARLEDEQEATNPGTEGRLVAVTGPGGTGASTVAIALAQGLAAGDAGARSTRGTGGGAPRVLLADLCRRADQAMLHDARVLVPGIQELVDAHRTSAPAPQRLLEQTFEVPARRYRLLLGLRQPRHWVALRPRAVERTLGSLLGLAEVVVADVEADLEGEVETGSVEVQDRNLLARSVMERADVVVVVGEPSMKGIHAQVRTVVELVGFGVPVERLLLVCNRAPRRPRARAEVASSLAALVRASVGPSADALAAPVPLPQRPIEQALRDGVALPGPLPRRLARGVAAVLERAGHRTEQIPAVPVRVVPGSLLRTIDEE
jgi:hypothetical protein